MKLIQKSFLQQITLEILDDFSLSFTSKSLFKKVIIRIPIEDIYIGKIYHRSHLDMVVFMVIILLSLASITFLLTKFRIYSNEDLFVVMSGIILILAIAYRILKSKSKIQIVIPTSGQGEILVDPDKPNKIQVDLFIMRLGELAAIHRGQQKTYSEYKS